MIPTKLPGTVLPEFIRCGKANCRCAGGELHGPYFYRFWRDDDGRLRKTYVRRVDLEAVRAACDSRQAEERRARTILGQGRAALDRLGRDERKRFRTPEDIEQLFAYPVAIRALLDLAGAEDADLMFRLRAIRSMARWRRRRLGAK